MNKSQHRWWLGGLSRWPRTLELVLESDGRRVVGVEEGTERVGVEAQVLQLALDLFETFLQLAVWDCLVDPVRGKACATTGFRSWQTEQGRV